MEGTPEALEGTVDRDIDGTPDGGTDGAVVVMTLGITVGVKDGHPEDEIEGMTSREDDGIRDGVMVMISNEGQIDCPVGATDGTVVGL